MTSYRKFENIISDYWEARSTTASAQPFWSKDGKPILDEALLEALLTKSSRDEDSARSGGLAKALDMWVAEELRVAGFDADAVWPRRVKPRVLDPAVLSFIGSLDARVAEPCCAALPKYASSTASVLGSTYSKQVDVGLSSWLTGPEILISTKTMSSSFGKNLANRFEEAYGDAKNLKGRHPLATLGFFFLLNATIIDEPRNLMKAITMLEKLALEVDAYDATCLLLFEQKKDGQMKLHCLEGRIPDSLSARRFFEKMVKLTLLRSSPDSHSVAREKLAACGL